MDGSTALAVNGTLLAIGGEDYSGGSTIYMTLYNTILRHCIILAVLKSGSCGELLIILLKVATCSSDKTHQMIEIA